MKITFRGFPLAMPFMLALMVAVSGCKDRSETPASAPNTQVQQELELTRAALEGGDVRGAIARAFALSEAHPDLVEARVLLSSAYVLDGKAIKALLEADKVIEAKPKLVGGWVARCAALQGQGRIEEAVEACQKALSIEANHGAALKNLAQLYGIQKKWREQGETLERLKSVDPDSSSVRIAVASNRAARGSKQDAIAEAKAGLERDPKNVSLLFFIAQASWEIDKIEEAMEYAELAAKFAPERTEFVELFQAAFTVRTAARLTCAHGPGPWTRDQKKDAIADSPIRGVQGVISFQRFYQDYLKRGNVMRRFKRAVERCQPQTQKPPSPPPPEGPAEPASPPAE